MRKLFFSFVAATVAATATFAQSSMLATLSHDGTISTFYGPTALRDAYAGAENGDVITLSSGSFTAVNLEKALTIRGAGMSIDPVTQTEPTILIGNFNIAMPEDVTERLTLEGIFHNEKVTITKAFNNGTFLKSRFKEITYATNNNNVINNLTMIHCKVSSNIRIPSGSSVSCVNSCISKGFNSDYGTFDFLNCIINGTEYSFFNGSMSIKNSIICTKYTSDYLLSSTVAYNCIGIGASDLFKNIPNTTNTKKTYAEVFKTYSGTYNDDENFELTDDAKTTLLGLDGTQVGMYGGNLPFDPTPTNPQITKCNVAAKSTADGKLSVDITVNGAQ